jgi:hypothetical protein
MPLKGSDNAEQIWNWLVGQGMSNQAAAGIMGNMKQESGFEPRIIQGGELADDCPASSYDGPEGAVGYGLCQWTGSRSKNLVAFAAAKGKHSGDLETQLEFMEKEAQERGCWTKVAAANTPEEAAQIWSDDFEGCGVSGNRISDSREIFEKQGKGVMTSSHVSGGGGGSTLGIAGLGFKRNQMGDMVTLTKLPLDKTMPCEPVYPDLITVSDTVPEWVLDATIVAANKQAEEEYRNKQAGINSLEISRDKKDAEDFAKFKDEQFAKWLVDNGHGFDGTEETYKQCLALYEQAAKEDDGSKFLEGIYYAGDATLKKTLQDHLEKEKKRKTKVEKKSTDKKDETASKEAGSSEAKKEETTSSSETEAKQQGES